MAAGINFSLSFITSIAMFIGSPSAGAQQLHVTDGDTIKLDNIHWRLWGMDAPEIRQTCADEWPAGAQAKQALEHLVAGRRIECEFRGHDRYKRSIGLCRADGQDLGAKMVVLGMAWAFTRYSLDYVGEEQAAIAGRLGVHAHDCRRAWEWRAERR